MWARRCDGAKNLKANCLGDKKPVFRDKEIVKSVNIHPNEEVHIWGCESNRILGPHQMWMKAILCTAVLNRGSDTTKADDKFDDYEDLPNIIKRFTSD